MLGHALRSILFAIALVLVFSSSVFAQGASEEATTLESDAQEQTTVSRGQQDEDNASQGQYEDQSQQQSIGQQVPENTPSQGCANPSEIATFSGGEEEDFRSELFGVSGDVLRIRYDIQADQNAIDDNITVTVLEEDGSYVDALLVFEPSSGSGNILLPEPGNYRLEVDAGEITYELAIDDCGGAANDSDNDTDAGNVPGNVIQDTIPDKVLVNTGGPSLLLPFSALMVGAGIAGYAVLRRR